MYKICLIGLIFLCSCALPVDNPRKAQVTITDGYVESRGAHLYFKIIGQGKPMIIVHGGPLWDHSYFLPYIMPLSTRYKLIFFDQRLSGRSSPTSDSTAISIEGFADDIEAIRDYLGLGHIYLLGHGWGGLMALKYTIDHPQNVDALILSSPEPANAKHRSLALNSQDTLLTTTELCEDHNILPDSLPASPQSSINNLLLLSMKSRFYNKAIGDSIYLYIPDDYLQRQQLLTPLRKHLTAYNYYSELTDLQTPTMLIYGAAEPSAHTYGQLLSDTLPRGEQVIILESGHFPFIEQPAAYFKKIEYFLYRH